MKKGIAIAGNMIVDQMYPVTGFPGLGELSTISGQLSRSVGGLLCNDIIDLAKLDPELPLVAMGRIGEDESGEYVMSKLRPYPNIDLRHIIKDGVTAFTLVIEDQITRQRTFFTYRGANADFGEQDIPWDELDVDILHIGYILLMDGLDAEDPEYGTVMARILHKAKERGIKTSIDVISEASDRFQRLVRPAMRYTDYCIINEVEAGESTGITLREADGTLRMDKIPEALRKMKDLGVSTWAVIHCPEVAMGLDEKDNLVEVPSLKLPEGWIAGTVGAGDAFCAGVLYGAWKEMDLKSALEMGTACAACSLSQPGGTEGVRSAEETMQLYRDMR